MAAAFYIAAATAVLTSILAVAGRNVVHALLFLVCSLLSLAVVFFTLGAPFAAALEVIVYAGAVMVLFVFVVMMLNLGRQPAEGEGTGKDRWLAPVFLSLLLLVEVLAVLAAASTDGAAAAATSVKEVGIALFGRYLPAVEITAFLLLAGLLGACHIAREDEHE